MLHKNIFTLAILLFCSSAHCTESSSFYIKGNYFGVLGNMTGEVSGKEDVADVTEGIISFSPNEKIVEGYKPKYTSGLNYGGAIGYSLDALQLLPKFPSRIEFEFLYSQINLDDEDYINNEIIKDVAKQFALFRNAEASYVDPHGPHGPHGPLGPLGRLGRFGQLERLNHGPSKDLFYHSLPHSIENRMPFIMENNGFNNLSGLVNVYYDLNIDSYFVPYISGGLGVTKVKFLGKSKYTPAFQLKVGAQYALTEKAQIFAGLRYFGIFSNKFKDILPIYNIIAGSAGDMGQLHPIHYDDTARVGSTTATINHRFGVYGLEVGMVYHF